jgi:DNA excision repair protein ERCC-4
LPPDLYLPALKSPGDLASCTVICIDTREQTPLPFSRLKTRWGKLPAGDYSIAGLEDEEEFAVERKTVPDLVGCCMGDNRDRFERELKLLRGYDFKRILVVGSRSDIEMQRYHSRITPRSVFGSLSAYEPCRHRAYPRLAALAN